MSSQPPTPWDWRERQRDDDADHWPSGGGAEDQPSVPPAPALPQWAGAATASGQWPSRADGSTWGSPDAGSAGASGTGVASRPGPDGSAWRAEAPQAGGSRDVAEAETQPRMTAPVNGRALADMPTERLAAQPATRQAWSSGWRVWLSRVALALGVLLLGVRAASASASFMQPGGGIIGWSVLPPAPPPLVILPPPTTSAQHQLTPSEYALWLAQHMSLDDELGQMIMIQYLDASVSPDLTKMIYSQHVGGALLLGRPVAPGDHDMSAQLQKLVGVPLFVAVDQEGGFVNRFLNVAGPLPGAAALQTVAAAQARGAQDATMLHQYGFNLNLAPVVDVGSPNAVGEFVGRSFSENPTQVAQLAGAYLQGLQQSGQVMGTLKHWPGGLIETGQDPHRRLPVLSRSVADWERIDVAPYRTLLAQGEVRAIMVSHEMIPTVDPKMPTSLSPTIIDGTLRGELGFDGVVITDDLVSMRAITDQWSLPEACVLAVKAGVDIVADMASSDQVQAVKDAMKQAVASGVLTRARIDTSVRRILTLKIQTGLIAMPQSAKPRPHRQPLDSGISPSAALDERVRWVRGMGKAA